MSVEAERQRTSRQHWAAPGGSHDRMVRLLKAVLPIVVGILAAILATAPFTREQEVSFVLDKKKVDVASERMKIVEALYRGEDSKGQPFSLRAGSAIQKSSKEPIVRMDDLEARLQVNGKPSVVSAQRGNYNMETEKVDIVGPLQFQAADGYRFTTRDVSIDMKTRQMHSTQRVDGRLPMGTFGADRMQADLVGQTIVLTGNARLHIDQNGLRAKK